MDPRSLLDGAQLTEAIQATGAALRDRPADGSLRLMLFELLCFEGAFDRALKQLDVIATQQTGPATEFALQTYRDLVAAEQTRHNVFHGQALPKFMLTPPAYADQYVIMVKRLHVSPSEGSGLLEAAEEAFPAATGHVDGKRFSEFRDADDRIGPMIEVFHRAHYIWVPIEQVARLEIAEPKSLRDLIWARATLQVTGQPAGEVIIPALYVDSHGNKDANVRLGRRTEWAAIDDQLVFGAGRRMMLVDGEAHSLLDLRLVQFDATAEARS